MNTERSEALKRQALLFDNRCIGCPYRRGDNKWDIYTDKCYMCPVRDEFLEIGEILLATLKPRKEIKGGEEEE